MAAFHLFVFFIVLSLVNGFVTNTLRLSKSLQVLRSSPGEISQSPSVIVKASTNQFQKIALPLAALASILLPVFSQQAFAAETAAPVEPKVELGPAPTDFGLGLKDYYGDATKMVAHMRYATSLEKGNPLLPEIAQKTKDEMMDFVSFYRRFNGVNGRQSFSLLYTSINVLSGHYTSYGVKFPVPEKRRKRLLQEYNDIEKVIRKKR